MCQRIDSDGFWWLVIAALVMTFISLVGSWRKE